MPMATPMAIPTPILCMPTPMAAPMAVPMAIQVARCMAATWSSGGALQRTATALFAAAGGLEPVERLQRLARGEFVGAEPVEQRRERVLGGRLGRPAGGGEQRQVVDQRVGRRRCGRWPRAASAPRGRGRRRRRQAGEAGDLDAVGAVGGAGRDLVQEDDIALPLLDAHGDVVEARQAVRQRGQLVIVGGEEGAASG